MLPKLSQPDKTLLQFLVRVSLYIVVVWLLIALVCTIIVVTVHTLLPGT
jgi:hypothetical protein